MLSFLNAIVELVDMREGQVLFRSNRVYEPGKTVSVRMVLPPGSGKIANLSVHIVSSRPLEKGGLLYVAQLTEEVMATYAGDVHDAALRRADRHNLGIRVMSKDLPGYKGMTVDLSRTGLQLELDGPVNVGQTLDLQLEFDRFDLPSVKARAQVRWCRAKDDHYRAGVQFEPSPALDKVADFFEQRSHADLETLLVQAKLHEKTPPNGTERRQQRRTTFMIPVDATVTALRWDLRERRLVLTLRNTDNQDHRLEFGDCQTFRDYGCAFGITAKTMRTQADSKLLQQVQSRAPGAYKHYEFLDSSQNTLLEIISAPVSALPSP